MNNNLKLIRESNNQQKQIKKAIILFLANNVEELLKSFFCFQSC